ncbi:MAG: J domain-containing protein [Cyanobacteria bacterium J06632_3]
MKLARHYRTLGLRRSASFGEVKAAYRLLVRQYHPDMNPDEQAIEQFIQINEAYNALSAALKGSSRGSSRADEKGSNGDQINRTTKKATDRLNLKELRLTLERLGLGNFMDSQEKAPSNGTVPDEMPGESLVEESPADERPINLGSSAVAESVGPSSSSTGSSGHSVQPSEIPMSAREAGLKQEAYVQLKALLQQKKFPRAIALVEGLAHRIPTDGEISQWQAIVYQRWGRYLLGEGQLQKARIYLKKAVETDPHNAFLCKEVQRDLKQLTLLAQAASVI